MSKKYTIDDMQSYAANSGGVCLSKEFKDVLSPLIWRCEKGHTWEADFEIIRQGGWCKQCLKGNKRNDGKLEMMRAIAKEKGGECLSNEYINNSTKLSWKCKEGHEWLMDRGALSKGQWCSVCFKNNYNEKIFDELKAIAIKHGGKCLSTEYITMKSKMSWECAEGHKWIVAPTGIMRNNTWCNKCAKKRIGESKVGDIAAIQKKAMEHGGKCLSTEFFGLKHKMDFECAKGHRWSIKPGNILYRNAWCNKCAYVKKGENARGNIQELQKIALKHGGKCLSENYGNGKEKLEWECSEGHRWKSAPYNIRAGRWCLTCGYIKNGLNSRDSIEVFRKIAKERGGKLLSETYSGNRVKLK